MGTDVERTGPPDGEAWSGLLDDTGTDDLRAKVDGAWREFAAALAQVLPTLPAKARLALTLDPTASGTGEAVYEVGIAAADGELAADAVGNADLPTGYRLDRAAVASMVALGWAPPGVVPDSGERFGLRVPPDAEAARRLAAVVSRTMRDVYATPHPAFLTYDIAPAEAAETLPPLGAARPITDVEPAEIADLVAGAPLAERVRAVVAGLLKAAPDSLTEDESGEISIRAGSAMVFVRLYDNPPIVDVYSPLLTEIQANERLYSRLSELTKRLPIGRLFCGEDTIWASVPVFGQDFQASHLMLAVRLMTSLADELDDRLQGEFGGKRFFGQSEKDKPTEEGRTGMYL